MTTTSASTLPHYEIRTWDLSDLLAAPTEAALTRELDRLTLGIDAFARERETLSAAMDPRAFLALLRQYQRLIEQVSVINGYANLLFSEDTQSSATLSLRNRVRQTMASNSNRILFFEIWWIGLEDAEAETLLPDAKDEADLRFFLIDLRRSRPYTLDEGSEQVINIKDTNGISAVLTLYAMLTNRMSFPITLDGVTQELTDGEVRSLFFSPDPVVRERAYAVSHAAYSRESKVLAQIYANRVRDWYSEHVELRGFSSPISVRNVSNDIPDQAVDTLLDTVRDNAGLFQEYFRLKAKWLGIGTVRRFDVYAPLASSDRKVAFPEAVTTVLETFRRFDPRLGELAERVLAEDHLDSEIRPGKRSGAFCSTVLPRLTPWVLVNYTGRVRDVATLAHELGHAVHSMLAAEHSILTQHPSLPLAETASVFAEMLMTDRLLREEQDPMARRELIAAAVDDVYATVLRQAYFVRFERAAHAAILDNRSADDLNALYMANLREQFGPDMEIDPAFEHEWIAIPHLFQTPFYCYSYSFGQLLVLALYRRYQEEGDAFKPGYIRLLARGGSERPEIMLREMGIDITDRAFWQGGFEVVRGMLDELKSLDV
jgi:oligoendopeptidase F